MSAGTEPVVSIDGDLVPASEARISALDRGFRGGEGVFTTLRADQGRVLRLAAHLERLCRDAAVLDLHLDPAELTTAVARTIAANAHLGSALALRITCSAGPVDLTGPFPSSGPRRTTVVVSAQPVGQPSAEGAVGHALPWHRPMAHLKTTSYLPATLAQRQAVAAGATDALLCDETGLVLEAASANLFVVRGGEIRTAPAGGAVLPGVTRTAVLEILAGLGLTVREVAVSLAELAGAEEAWLTSSVRGVRALTHLDDVPLGTGRMGPVTAQVEAAYAALLAREQEPVPELRS